LSRIVFFLVILVVIGNEAALIVPVAGLCAATAALAAPSPATSLIVVGDEPALPVMLSPGFVDRFLFVFVLPPALRCHRRSPSDFSRSPPIGDARLSPQLSCHQDWTF